MTAQTPDRLLFNGYEFHIVEASETMFDPITHGFQPVSPHTACWRGYILHFAIANRHLLLRTLEVNQKAPSDVWYGVVPKPGTFARMPLWVLYEEVNLSIEFSGRIVIARKFIDDYYVHLGFQTWYGY